MAAQPVLKPELGIDLATERHPEDISLEQAQKCRRPSS